MIKASIHQENKRVLNSCIFNSTTSKHMNQKLIEMQWKKRQIPNYSKKILVPMSQ